jgi:hypothetical protein
MNAQLVFIISIFLATCLHNGEKSMQIDSTKNTHYWEELTDEQKSETLKDKRVFNEAILLYNKKFNPSDNEQTIQLLDTLSNLKGGNIGALYFYLFNDICKHADGALAEIVGSYCQLVILNSPEYVINYFIDNEDLRKEYARFLGYELYFKEEGTSDLEYNYEDFKALLTRRLSNQERFKQVLTLFFKDIDTSMKNMN